MAPTLYVNHSCHPKDNAQRNLGGRTHYVDDGTLRWHKARILSARSVCNGLLFTIIESAALDMDNTRRGFRYVVFDVFGNVVSRVNLDGCWRTAEAARKALDAFLGECDAKALTLEAAERDERQHAMALRELRAKVAEIAGGCAP